MGNIGSLEEQRPPLWQRGARELLVRESHDGLFRGFFRLMGSPDKPADLIQDPFLALWDYLAPPARHDRAAHLGRRH